MKIGSWDLGWSRQVAIGVMWTSPRMGRPKQITLMFLGVTLSRGLPVIKSKEKPLERGPCPSCGAEVGSCPKCRGVLPDADVHGCMVRGCKRHAVVGGVCSPHDEEWHQKGGDSLPSEEFYKFLGYKPE